MSFYSCNITDNSNNKTDEFNNDISVLINGKQWKSYFEQDEIVQNSPWSSIGYPGTIRDEIDLIIYYDILYKSGYRESMGVVFAFPEGYDFNTLKEKEANYLTTKNRRESLNFTEIDYDVIIAPYDRYDSTKSVTAKIIYFNYQERTVDVTFEGILILNEWNIAHPYPGGNRWPDTLKITEGRIRCKFKDLRLGE